MAGEFEEAVRPVLDVVLWVLMAIGFCIFSFDGLHYIMKVCVPGGHQGAGRFCGQRRLVRENFVEQDTSRVAVVDFVTEKVKLHLADWLLGIPKITVEFSNKNLDNQSGNQAAAWLHDATEA